MLEMIARAGDLRYSNRNERLELAGVEGGSWICRTYGALVSF